MSRSQPNEKTCIEKDCERPVEARDLCSKHYMRWYRATKPEVRQREHERRKKTAEQRQEYSRRYYRENRERILAREKAYRADPDVKKAKADRTKRWREAHPEASRQIHRRGIAKKHGITLEEYEETLANGCAICGTRRRRLCLDHDHGTGKVRGALCHSCNSGLGLFADDPSRLRTAADYIEAALT